MTMNNEVKRVIFLFLFFRIKDSSHKLEAFEASHQELGFIEIQTLGFMSFSLGFMYCIGIHVTTFGSMTMHQAMTRMPHPYSYHMNHSELASLLSWMLY
jgi:hypothetical protein